MRDNDRRLANIAPPPEIASYFSDPSGLIFDPARELRFNPEHIVTDNINRFPEGLRTNPLQLRLALEGAINTAKKRARRNYKTAIPQFYNGRLQLLLPLSLEKPGATDLALVLSREGEVYMASTVLPIQWAHNNARLIARPDREWLKP